MFYTKVFSRENKIITALESIVLAIEIVKNWFAYKKCSLNEDKTQMIVCSLNMKINCSSLEEVKLLGVIIDQKMTRRNHTANVCTVELQLCGLNNQISDG